MVNMRTVTFPDWADVLASDTSLKEQEQRSYTITIRWFLGYCRRMHRRADFECARDFIAEVVAERRPGNWSRKRLRLTRF